MHKTAPIKLLKNQKGLSLLEILIVLAILGTVAAMLISRVTGGLEKAKVQETKLAIGQIVQAINLYYTDCAKYPASLENLVTADSNCSNWGPEPYLKRIPKDAWDKEFSYEVENGNFHVKSSGGKSGKEINSDDVAQ